MEDREQVDIIELLRSVGAKDEEQEGMIESFILDLLQAKREST